MPLAFECEPSTVVWTHPTDRRLSPFQEPEPKVDVYEAADGVLDVIIRTIAEDKLASLSEIPRRAPKRVH